MKYLLPSRLYDVLKWIGLCAAPAVAVLLAALGGAWGFDAEPWVLTVNAVGVFIGALIGVSAASAKDVEPSDDHAPDGGTMPGTSDLTGIRPLTDEEAVAVLDHED